MKPTRRPVYPRSSAAHIQRRTPGLALDEAQFESAVAQRPWHAPLAVPPRSPSLEGPRAGPLPAHHVHVSLEGPQAAGRRRPHIAHVLERGPHPPIRKALDRRFVLEGPPLKLIQREGLNPSLIHHRRSK